MATSRELIDILTEHGSIPAPELERVTRLRDERGGVLSEILLQERLIDEDDLFFLMSRRLGVPAIPEQRLLHLTLSPDIRRRVSRRFAEKNVLVPLDLDPRAGALSVAMFEPSDHDLLGHLSDTSRVVNIRPYLARRSAILAAISSAYGPGEDIFEQAEPLPWLGPDLAPADQNSVSRRPPVLEPKVQLDPSLAEEIAAYSGLDEVSELGQLEEGASFSNAEPVDFPAERTQRRIIEPIATPHPPVGRPDAPRRAAPAAKPVSRPRAGTALRAARSGVDQAGRPVTPNERRLQPAPVEGPPADARRRETLGRAAPGPVEGGEPAASPGPPQSGEPVATPPFAPLQASTPHDEEQRAPSSSAEVITAEQRRPPPAAEDDTDPFRMMPPLPETDPELEAVSGDDFGDDFEDDPDLVGGEVTQIRAPEELIDEEPTPAAPPALPDVRSMEETDTLMRELLSSVGVLVSMLHERIDPVGGGYYEYGRLSRLVARELGMDELSIERIALAAHLYGLDLALRRELGTSAGLDVTTVFGSTPTAPGGLGPSLRTLGARAMGLVDGVAEEPVALRLIRLVAEYLELREESGLGPSDPETVAQLLRTSGQDSLLVDALLRATEAADTRRIITDEHQMPGGE